MPVGNILSWKQSGSNYRGFQGTLHANSKESQSEISQRPPGQLLAWTSFLKLCCFSFCIFLFGRFWLVTQIPFFKHCFQNNVLLKIHDDQPHCFFDEIVSGLSASTARTSNAWSWSTAAHRRGSAENFGSREGEGPSNSYYFLKIVYCTWGLKGAWGCWENCSGYKHFVVVGLGARWKKRAAEAPCYTL